MKRLAVSFVDGPKFHFEHEDTWVLNRPDRITLCGLGGEDLFMSSLLFPIELAIEELHSRSQHGKTCAECLLLAEELRDPVSRLADIS